MTKTCLYCAYWKPEGTIRKIVRHGGDCKLTGKDTQLKDSCWAWKICSPGCGFMGLRGYRDKEVEAE